jgi:hypothetical protein
MGRRWRYDIRAVGVGVVANVRGIDVIVLKSYWTISCR